MGLWFNGSRRPFGSVFQQVWSDRYMDEHIDVEGLLEAWKIFQQRTGISPIRDESHYDYMTVLLGILWDRTKGDERSPLSELCDLVGAVVHQYESCHHKMAEASGVDALRFLMQELNLGPADLPEIGRERDVLELLEGHRQLTRADALSLAKRFNISPSTFYP